MNKNKQEMKVDELVNGFYQVPKFLFDEQFKKLNSTSKILYAMMKERHEVSLKNKWVDDNGDIYHVMPQEYMAKELNVTVRTVQRCLKQLTEHMLVESVQIGFRKPSHLYLNMMINVHSRNNSMLANRKRFNERDYLNSLFLQLPRFLMERYYSHLSTDAKILYAILKDRLNLSLEKDFMYLDDVPYVIYSRQELADNLGVSRPTVIKVMKELVTHNLINEIKYGFGDHNKIFITDTPKKIVTDELSKSEKRLESISYNPDALEKYRNTHSLVTLQRSKELSYQEVKNCRIKKLKFVVSRSKELSYQEVKNCRPSYTDFSYTDFSYTESNLSICLSLSKLLNSNYDDKLANAKNIMEVKNILEDMISEKYDFEELSRHYEKTYYSEKASYLNSIKDVVVSSLLIPESHYLVGKQKVPFELMAEVMINLDTDKITQMINNLFEIDYEIKNMRSYILSMIYSTSQTYDAQTMNYFKQR